MAKDAPPRTRKRRWLRRTLAILVIGPIVTIAVLPTLLSTAPVRSVVLALANRALAPARLDIAAWELSWVGTPRALGVVLSDPQGKRLVAISRVSVERSVLELLFDHSNLGTVTLEGLKLDVERRRDGVIDLVEVFTRLAGPPRSEPAPRAEVPVAASKGLPVDFTLKVVQGALQVRAPELPEPLAVDRFDLNVQSIASEGPLNVRLRMEKGPAATASASTSTLGIDATYDLRSSGATAADLSLNLLARRWPFSARVAGVDARGRLEGQVEVVRKQGRWDFRGDTRLVGLDASGPALAGDRLQLDLVSAIWDVVQGSGPGAELWAVRRLSLTSPVASVSANGPILGMPGTGARAEVRVDLAALAKQVPHALRIRDGLALERGEAQITVGLGYEADSQSIALDALLSDVVAHDAARTIALRNPASLTARVKRHGSNLDLEQLSLTSEFVQTTGSGDLDQGIKVTGALDLGAFQGQFRDLIDFGGVTMAGQGDYALTYKRTGERFSGVLTSDVRGLDLKGLTADPIHREALKIESAASGGCDPSGIPRSLADLKVRLTAGQIGAFAAATTQNDTMALSLVATGPITLAEQVEGVARADLRFQGAWHAPALEIGELRLKVHPAGVAPESSPLALALTGQFDQARGEVVLNTIAGIPPASVAIAPAAGGLKVSGLGHPASSLKVEGSLAGDLAVLDQLIAGLRGGQPYDLAGRWTGLVSAQPLADGRLQLAARIDAPDLSRGGAPGQPRTQEGPLALAVRCDYRSEGGQLGLEELGVVAPLASLSAKGQVADATGRRVADLQGTLYPNWQTLNTLAASALEPGTRLQGGAPRAFRVKGPLSGGSAAEILKGLDAELGLELAGAQSFGLRLGPAPLVVRCGGGRTIIDPIATSLNNGRVDVRPEVVLDDPRGLALRLLPGSTLQNIEINDEVSQKVLTFIAPVLEQATQVHGTMSATFERAEFPIGGDADRTMTVTGALVFNNVVFGAGPFGSELLSLAGKGPDTALRIHQPIQLAIANRRIHQSGLEIPINHEAKLTIKGSVGFDETLALRAEMPLSGSVAGRDPVLRDLARGTTIAVPVAGTLKRPKVDRQALAAAMREASKSLLKREVKEEGTELLKRFLR
jgi:translocation and assembly module TamB